MTPRRLGIRIDSENFEVADEAMRQILYLYHEIALGGRIANGDDRSDFDHFAFSCVEIHEEPGSSLGYDTALLRAGSGISMLCSLSDSWDQSDPRTCADHPYFERVRQALSQGALADHPQLKGGIEIALARRPTTEELAVVFDLYIAGYYRKMMAACGVRGVPS